MASPATTSSSLLLVLPKPLARTSLSLSSGGVGIPKTINVTQWGTPLESAKHVVFYFGGMPASAQEPAMHSATSASSSTDNNNNNNNNNKDVYDSRKIHLVCLDKVGMGGTSFAYRFQIRRDWPKIVDMVATKLNIESRYGVVGMSNGGPYVMSTLTHPDLKHRVKAGCMVVGVSDVWASGYFSWKTPSTLFEGIYNSLPLIISGPLNALAMLAGKIVVRCMNIDSLLPGMSREAKPVFLRLLSDGAARCGLGAAIDCQQGLSPLFARSSSQHSPTSVDRNASEAYAEISVPVSLWYGTKDGSVPMSSAEWLNDQLPNSELHKVDATHFLYFSHVNEILDDLVAKMEESDASVATKREDG